ncbi:MAG: F-box protein [Chlamydiota bacterium]
MAPPLSHLPPVLLNHVRSSDPTQQAPAQQPHTLPPELLSRVLSFLPTDSVPSALAVNREWKDLAFSTTYAKELFDITHFAQFLKVQLGSKISPEQQESLTNIRHGLKISNTANLVDLKVLLLQMKRPIINVLKTLSHEDLIALRESADLSIPTFFEDIFTLAEMYKRADTIQAMPNADDRQSAYQEIFTFLINGGNIAHAISFANTTFHDNNITRTSIVNALKSGTIAKSYLLEAIPESLQISDEFNRAEIIKELSMALLKKGNVESVIKVIYAIPETERGLLLYRINITLLEEENTNLAVQFACALPDKKEREAQSYSITSTLLQQEKVDQAVIYVNSISDKKMKDQHYYTIISTLKEQGKVDQARSIANAIADKRLREQMLYVISPSSSSQDSRMAELIVTTVGLIAIGAVLFAASRYDPKDPKDGKRVRPVRTPNPRPTPKADAGIRANNYIRWDGEAAAVTRYRPSITPRSQMGKGTGAVTTTPDSYTPSIDTVGTGAFTRTPDSYTPSRDSEGTGAMTRPIAPIPLPECPMAKMQSSTNSWLKSLLDW